MHPNLRMRSILSNVIGFGNKTIAAKKLGIGLKTLYRKLVKYGVIGKEEEQLK